MAKESSVAEMTESVVPQQKGKRATADDETPLLDLLIVLAQRKRLILLVTASFAVLSITVSLLLPVRYTATVILLPPQQKSSMGALLGSELGSLGAMASLAGGLGGGLGIKNPNDMYVAMFKSHTVEDGMVRHFGLMQEYHAQYLSVARTDFEHNTKVEGNGKDGLIHISVEDSNAKRAAELANGYVDQFRDLSQHLAITEAAQRAVFFKQQLHRANQNLVKAEDALVQTEKKTGIIQVNAQASALIASATSLNAQIAAKEVQIQGMRTYATGDNAQLVQAEQELQGLRAQLAKLGGGHSLTAGGIIVPKGMVPTASLEYVRKMRDAKYYQTIFDILAQQFELAKLDEAKEGALIQVVDPATPPDRRSSPKRKLIVIIGTLVGLFVAVLLALWQGAYQAMKDDPANSAKLRLLQKALTNR